MISRRLSLGFLCIALSAGLPGRAGDRRQRRRASWFIRAARVSATIRFPAAVEALKAIGAKAGYTVDATEDPEVFTRGEAQAVQGASCW